MTITTACNTELGPMCSQIKGKLGYNLTHYSVRACNTSQQ